MSYCRFQNTLTDLGDCHDNMNNTDDLSPVEARRRLEMIKLCVQIAKEFSDECDDK